MSRQDDNEIVEQLRNELFDTSTMLAEAQARLDSETGELVLIRVENEQLRQIEK